MNEYILIETRRVILKEDYYLSEFLVEKSEDFLTKFIKFMINGLERL